MVKRTFFLSNVAFAMAILDAVSPEEIHTTCYHATQIQGHRKRWTGFETAITKKVLDGFTRLAS
jgi:hypothetical protein